MDTKDEKLTLKVCEAEEIALAEAKDKSLTVALTINSVAVTVGLLLLIILPFVASVMGLPYKSDVQLVGAVAGAFVILTKALSSRILRNAKTGSGKDQ